MMRLSTRQRYATRILVYLARHGDAAPARKNAIAKAEAIPADYVEQICMRLKSAGLIASYRGKNGGFALAREPAAITVADGLAAVDGKLTLAPCVGQACARAGACPTRALWQRANAALQGVLEGTTIRELADEAATMAARQTHSFEI